MSCSKFDMPTPAINVMDPLNVKKMLVGTRTHLGHQYIRRLEAFSVKQTDGVRTHYLMQIFDTPNKKGVSKTTSCFLWKVLKGFECVESFMVPDTVHTMDDGRELRDIHCPLAVEMMLTLPKCLIAAPFTTNDLAKFDSFSFGSTSNTCIEHSVMCHAKTLFVMSEIQALSPDSLFEYYLSSKFIDADTIRDILEKLDNDRRFHTRAPKDLSEEELKAWNAEALCDVRKHMQANVSPEHFKELVLAWLSLNLVIPRKLDPAVYKDKIGRRVPMTPEMVAKWNSLSGLLFLLATSKHYRQNRVDLQLAIPAAFNGAWIAEITPKDQRWGVSPPNKKDLEWVCKDPAGKMWLLNAVRTHGAAQEAFVEKLKSILYSKDMDERRRDEEAMVMLTEGLDQYKHGILGLVKSIFLRTLSSEILVKPTLARRMEIACEHYNIFWWFHSVMIQDAKPDEKMDPFELLQSVGDAV